MELLEKLFKEQGLRLTEPRKDVFTILNTSENPLTLGEIVKASQLAERTSVYRTLLLFTNLGVVDMIQIGFKQRYELAEPFRPHHHHLVCIQCGSLVDLERTPRLEKLVHKLAATHGYELRAHHIELQGICSHCQRG